RLHRGAAGPVLRVTHVHPDPGTALTAAVIQVAAHAPKPVADVRRKAVARGGEQGAPAADGRAERPIGNEGIAGPAEHDPPLRGWARSEERRVGKEGRGGGWWGEGRREG